MDSKANTAILADFGLGALPLLTLVPCRICSSTLWAKHFHLRTLDLQEFVVWEVETVPLDTPVLFFECMVEACLPSTSKQEEPEDIIMVCVCVACWLLFSAPKKYGGIEEYGFNLPDHKLLQVHGTEMEVFGPEGRAADTTGYEREEGQGNEAKIDEDRRDGL